MHFNRDAKALRGLLRIALAAFLSAARFAAADDLKPGDYSLEIAGAMERHTYTDSMRGGSFVPPTMRADQRLYLLHVPALGDGTRRPLVLMLHGAGGSAAGASKAYGWLAASDKYGFEVAFPQATANDPSKPANFGTNPRYWNDGSGRGAVGRRDEPDIDFLNHVLDDIESKSQIDVKRIYVAGFSSGGSMSFRVGAEMANRIAAIAPVSGELQIKDPHPARPIPTLYMIGDSDPLNPYNGGQGTNPWGKPSNKPTVQQTVDDWRNAIGASSPAESLSGAPETRTVGYSGPHDAELIFITVIGQGHEWPGRPRVLPESVSGPSVDTYHATEAIWSFFSRHELP
jgi:polyhydroxybutyrate depolymerase